MPTFPPVGLRGLQSGVDPVWDWSDPLPIPLETPDPDPDLRYSQTQIFYLPQYLLIKIFEIFLIWSASYIKILNPKSYSINIFFYPDPDEHPGRLDRLDGSLFRFENKYMSESSAARHSE